MAESLTIRTASSTEVVKISVPGPQGPAGQGVPVGGSTGQVLRKASGSDYDTEWAAAGSGSGSVTSVALASTDLTISGSPITSSGTITANIAANAVTLEKLQTISSEHLLGRHGSGNGGVQQIGLGTGLAISGSNVRVATTGITAGTYTKLTIDETGRATVGATATPSDIGAQSLFETQNLTLTTDTELTANRAKQYNVIRLNSLTITLPTTGHLAGDIVVIYNIPAGSGTLTIRRGGASESFWTLAASEQLRWRATGTGASDWELVRVDSHSADRITSGTLAHERGGLEADVSAYSGLVKISGGSTSAVTVTSAGEALLDDVDAAAQRTTLGLGTAATSATGDFAAASHSHGNINSSGQIGSTAGLPVVTTTSGAVSTLALGAAGTVLTVNSGATGVEFAAAAASGVSAVNSTLADILSVSGSDLVADDLGSDKLYGFDDSEGKAIGFTIGSGLSVSGDTLSATATGTIGGSTGSTDNSLLRSDGTGGSTVQDSELVIDDATTSTQANVALRNNHSASSSALVLTPKGAGALINGPKPDGTSTGGNARGARAVDLQYNRNSAAQVASGESSFIGSGWENRASVLTSAVVCGIANHASGQSAFIGGGRSNTASAQAAAVCGGGDNTQGGNSASAEASAILGGYAGVANRWGIQAHAAGRFGANGDAQRIRAVLRCKTTTNSAVEMALDGSTTYLTIPSGKVIFCNIKVVGVKSDGSVVATYERQYAAKNVAGTSSEVFAPVTIGTDNASSTSLEVATVDAGDYIRIRPTGIASETWRWVASVDAVEVAYGS